MDEKKAGVDSRIESLASKQDVEDPKRNRKTAKESILIV
jgi:hypothetical protein